MFDHKKDFKKKYFVDNVFINLRINSLWPGFWNMMVTSHRAESTLAQAMAYYLTASAIT